uniref:peroxiredoxin-like family protein n=1 Tax=Aliarcobacter sp. TaxID=2321116 RepID=UPI004048AC50
MSRLLEEIKKYQESFKKKVPEDIQKIMLNATKKLELEKISKKALKVGDIAKDFNLKNILNENISLDNLIKENDFVVISFYRGTWCPYCNLELKALQKINDELINLNTKLVAISPQTPDESLSTKEKNELEFEVLSDTNSIISKKYGLVFNLADELKPIYESFGIKIPQSNGVDTYELPMPAVFVINKNKEILFSFIDEDYTKRCEPKTILDTIRKNS